MSDQERPWRPWASSESERLTGATQGLTHELRRQRDDRMREQYRNVHPSEWPPEHPDWGSSRFEPWGGPEWVREPERPGPRPMTTAEEVELARQELEDRGMPSGERSIAKLLGVSRDAVRYALGKDRR